MNRRRPNPPVFVPGRFVMSEKDVRSKKGSPELIQRKLYLSLGAFESIGRF